MFSLGCTSILQKCHSVRIRLLLLLHYTLIALVTIIAYNTDQLSGSVFYVHFDTDAS